MVRRGVLRRGKNDGLDIANKTIGPSEVDHIRNQWANRPNEEPIRERYPRRCQPALLPPDTRTDDTPL